MRDKANVKTHVMAKHDGFVAGKFKELRQDFIDGGLAAHHGVRDVVDSRAVGRDMEAGAGIDQGFEGVDDVDLVFIVFIFFEFKSVNHFLTTLLFGSFINK